MINQGFTETQKHLDKRLDKMNERLGGMDEWMGHMEGVLKDVVQELTATHEDVRYIRTTVTMLVRNGAAHDAAIASLRKRMERVERKVGIAK